MIQASMQGARLAYVVVPLEGMLKREKIEFVEKPAGKNKDGSARYTFTMKKVLKEEPAGFLVYFPRGHVIRVRSKEKLVQYGLDKPSKLVNLQGLADPNSPLGQLLMHQDESGRREAWSSLEQKVIQLATAKTGPIVLPEQVQGAYTPPTTEGEEAKGRRRA
jgi:hypothetical protein